MHWFSLSLLTSFDLLDIKVVTQKTRELVQQLRVIALNKSIWLQFLAPMWWLTNILFLLHPPLDFMIIAYTGDTYIYVGKHSNT